MQFVVEGRPQPKERPRVFKGHAITPQKTKDYEETIAWAAKAKGIKITDKPVRLLISAHFEYLKTDKARCMSGEKQPNADVDNLAKSVLDGLNGVAYIDDRQVVSLTVTKRYSDKAFLLVDIQEV